MIGDVATGHQSEGVKQESGHENPSGVLNDFRVHRTGCEHGPEIEYHQDKSSKQVEIREIPENIYLVVKNFQRLFGIARNKVCTEFVLKLADQGQIIFLPGFVAGLHCIQVIREQADGH